jgi:Tfp pilus assembly protein PilN
MNGWWKNKNLVLSHLSFMRTFSTTFMLTGSLIFVGWISADKFVGVYNSQASVQTVMDLERDISQLRVQYRDTHPEALQADLEQADQHLIQDFTDLAHWAQDLQEQGDRLDLQMYYRILKTEQSPSSIQGITIIPLEFQISSRNDRSGYRAFLQFLQGLEGSGPRITFQEVTVTGDGKKAMQFTVGLSVWMKTHDSVEL